MKPIIVGLALVFGGVIASPVAAQRAQTPASEPAHKVFVLTGCLTGGTAETAAFKLTGAVPVGQVPKAGATTAGPDGKDVYELLPTVGLTEQGIAKAELQKHVGKKVEVTVRPVEVVPGPSPSTTLPPAVSTVKPEQAPPQRYTVTAIKSFVESCL